LAGTEEAYAPFFSPDGLWVAFFAQGTLKKIRVDGGQPVPLYSAPAGRGGSWGEDNTIIAALDQSGGLMRIPSEGGRAVAVTKLNLDAGETTHRWPQVLPRGKYVLFTVSFAYGRYDDANIAVASVAEGQPKTLLEHTGTHARYLPGGHLVYVRKGTLFAVPLDIDRLKMGDKPTALWQVASNSITGFAQFDFSPTGILSYRGGAAEGLRTIQWLERDGRTTDLGLEPGQYTMIRLSPDGHRVLYALSQTQSNLWIYDFERGTPTVLTDSEDAYPIWSSDGAFVLFQRRATIFWKRVDSADSPRPLIDFQPGHRQIPFSFDRTGTKLAYFDFVPGSLGSIRTMSVEKISGQLRAGDSQPLLKEVENTPANAMFSPDGGWIAYAVPQGGRYQVSVTPSKSATPVQISNSGGFAPVWSPNGRELFYRTDDQRIMVVPYTIKGNSFVAEKPKPWSNQRLANTGIAVNFDIAPDSKRVLALMPVQTAATRETQSHVMVMTNFFDEVRRRVAASAAPK
jgi:Tol biopolymer transport system component